MSDMLEEATGEIIPGNDDSTLVYFEFFTPEARKAFTEWFRAYGFEHFIESDDLEIDRNLEIVKDQEPNSDQAFHYFEIE